MKPLTTLRVKMSQISSKRQNSVTKRIKELVYEGLGFPVILEDVEVVEFMDELHPKLDVRQLADHVVDELLFKKDDLTPEEEKFVNNYFRGFDEEDK